MECSGNPGSLRAKLVEEMELKPRHAFGPARVAVSGKKVSPPLFESMEILGRESTSIGFGPLVKAARNGYRRCG